MGVGIATGGGVRYKVASEREREREGESESEVLRFVNLTIMTSEWSFMNNQ